MGVSTPSGGAAPLQSSMHIRTFKPADEDEVVALWDVCGLIRPWNNPHRDISRKLAEQPELFLVAEEGDTVIGSVMAGFDGHRGWIYYLAVSPAQRGKSHGQNLVRAAEQLLLQRGCPKINLMVRSGNEPVLEFYRNLGYTMDEVVTMSRRLIADD